MPNFRHRLTRAQQRIYDRSDSVSSIRLTATAPLRAAVMRLPAALATGDRDVVQKMAQGIADEICRALHVSRTRVLVDEVRPANARGELHGLYTAGGRGGALIRVWMMTAKRGKVVAFKTFLRTLLHEICHHLDYVFLRLPDSFHTTGFYQRESSLFYQIGGAVASESSTAKVVESETTARGASPATIRRVGGAA